MKNKSQVSIKSIIRDCNKPREILRVIILVLLSLRISVITVSSVIGIHRSTVYRSRGRYALIVGYALADKPRKGRRKKVTVEFEKVLIIDYHILPRTLGYAQNYWTLGLLVIHLGKKTGIKVCKNTIRNVLISNGFRCARPKQRIHSPDPEYLTKKKRIEKIIRKPPKNSVILYEDEHDAHLNPSIRRCFARQGEQMKVYTPGQNKKLYIFGGYCPYGKRIVAWRIFRRKRSEEFFEFLKYLICLFKGKKLILILDNFTIHKCKKLQKMLDDNPWVKDKIEFVWLPTYAPELNPIEREWGTIKGRSEANYLFTDEGEFRNALHQSLKARLKEDVDVVQSHNYKKRGDKNVAA